MSSVWRWSLGVEVVLLAEQSLPGDPAGVTVEHVLDEVDVQVEDLDRVPGAPQLAGQGGQAVRRM